MHAASALLPRCRSRRTGSSGFSYFGLGPIQSDRKHEGNGSHTSNANYFAITVESAVPALPEARCAVAVLSCPAYWA